MQNLSEVHILLSLTLHRTPTEGRTMLVRLPWDLVKMQSDCVEPGRRLRFCTQTHPSGVHAAGLWTALWGARDKAHMLMGTGLRGCQECTTVYFREGASFSFQRRLPRGSEI